MTVKAIIFDLDETLIEDREATHSAFVKACAYAQEQVEIDCERLRGAAHKHARQLWRQAPTYSYCHAIGISASEGMWGRFMGEEPEHQALRQWVPTFQRQLWELALAEQGINDLALAERLAAIFREERSTCYRVFADVEAALSDFRQRYTLALLTNGASDLQREKIEASCLGHYFDVVVVSGEVGIGKPEPGVFTHVLERLDIAPEQAVMVGDSLPRDIQGAYRSGMRGIWLNRFGDESIEEYASMISAQICLLDELEATFA